MEGNISEVDGSGQVREKVFDMAEGFGNCTQVERGQERDDQNHAQKFRQAVALPAMFTI